MFKIAAAEPTETFLKWVLYYSIKNTRIEHTLVDTEEFATEFADLGLAIAIVNKLNRGKRKKYFISEIKSQN